MPFITLFASKVASVRIAGVLAKLRMNAASATTGAGSAVDPFSGMMLAGIGLYGGYKIGKSGEVEDEGASKEQVESLGGKFLSVEGSENLETEGGYAKETSKISIYEFRDNMMEFIT